MAPDERRTPPVDIPLKKLFFNIGEVSEICEVPAHTLRKWEKDFEQLKDLKRSSNRRVYTQDDIRTIVKIRELIQDKGLTVEGVRKHLSQSEARSPSSIDPGALEPVIDELESIRKMLKAHD